jgi:hypothetical protein
MRTRTKCTALVVFSFLAILVSTGCKKEDQREEGDKATAEPAGESQEDKITETTKSQTERPERSLKIEMKDENAGEKEEAPSEGEEELPVLGKEFLLVNRGASAVVPEDMVIGRLQPSFTEDPEEDDVYETVDIFLSFLVEGKIAERTIASEWRPAIYRGLLFLMERGTTPDSYRIGEVHVTGGRGNTNVRLISGLGRTSGEILLEPFDGSWLITEVQVDLNELTEPYETPEVYEPGVYRWLNHY